MFKLQILFLFVIANANFEIPVVSFINSEFVLKNERSNNSSKSKFKAFITEFESDKDEGAEPWDEEFNLSYNQK